MQFPRENYEKQIDCVLLVTCYKVKNVSCARHRPVLSGAEQYFSRNLRALSICQN